MRAQAAMATLDCVATVATYAGTVTYPANNGFARALRAVAGAMVRGIGKKVFYVTTGGHDTHSGQNVNANNRTYSNLMGTLNDGLTAFYNDLTNQGLLGDTLVITFSEFGRRITENGSNGTDHGAASVMMAIGGRVNGGLYGTAPNLNPDPANPRLETAGTTWRTRRTSGRCTLRSSTGGSAAIQGRFSALIFVCPASASSDPISNPLSPTPPITLV